MKRLLLILLLIPGLAFGAFTEFYCQTGGSNLNAGSTTNNSAAYTSTNGNWSTVTNVFTPTDGSTPASSIAVGDFVSIYLDAASVGVFVARVTLVAAGVNGGITVSGTVRAGTQPTTGATGRSLKAGGAWKGPNAASGFPISMGGKQLLKNVSGDQVRVNFKNDATYSITSQITSGTDGAFITMQGYTGSPGDGGRAVFDGGTSTAGILNAGSTGSTWADFEFKTSFTTGSTTAVTLNSTAILVYRVIVHGARGSGVLCGGTMVECEVYDCNKSNTSNLAGFQVNSGNLIRCYSHDNTTANSKGFRLQGPAALVQCISESNGGEGIQVSAGSDCIINLTDLYNNTGDGIVIPATANMVHIENCNFIKNGGSAINNSGNTMGVIYNAGYGSGTQANGAGDVLGPMFQTGTITYEANVTPYSAPTTGNFTLVNTSTILGFGTGRGTFTETDGTNTGTVGYPDIGAAQHYDTCANVGPCPGVSYGFGF